MPFQPQQEKWKEHISCMEQDNADTSQHAQELEEKVTSTNWFRTLAILIREMELWECAPLQNKSPQSTTPLVLGVPRPIRYDTFSTICTLLTAT